MKEHWRKEKRKDFGWYVDPDPDEKGAIWAFWLKEADIADAQPNAFVSISYNTVNKLHDKIMEHADEIRKNSDLLGQMRSFRMRAMKMPANEGDGYLFIMGKNFDDVTSLGWEIASTPEYKKQMEASSQGAKTFWEKIKTIFSELFTAQPTSKPTPATKATQAHTPKTIKVELDPNWLKEGKTFTEYHDERAKKFNQPGSMPMDYQAIFNPYELIENTGPTNYAVCVFNKEPLVVTKLDPEGEKLKQLKRTVSDGQVMFRSEVYSYPTYPILYSRMFITLSAINNAKQIGLSGLLSECAGKMENADLQEWTKILRHTLWTQLYVYNSSGELLAKGKVEVKKDIADLLFNRVSQANYLLKKIDPSRRDFHASTRQFFQDFPEAKW